MNRNWSNSINFFWYKSICLISMGYFDLFIDNSDLLINSLDLLINLYWSFNQKEIKNNQLKSKIDQNYIEIAILDLIVESEFDRNRWSLSDGLKSESSMIWFWRPNRISLNDIRHSIPFLRHTSFHNFESRAMSFFSAPFKVSHYITSQKTSQTSRITFF